MIAAMITTPNVYAAAPSSAKIGLLTPKTGALGSLGMTFENGANLAIDDLNAKYPDTTFELVVQDTQTSASGAEAAADALVTAGVSGVIGAAASSSSLAAIEKLKAAQIPMVSYASTSPALTTNEDDGYMFRVLPSDGFQGRAGGLLAFSAGAEKVAVININDPYGQGLANAFKEAFLANGENFSIAVERAYDQETTTDFAADVTALIDSAPDAIYMVSFVDDGAAIINELSSQGFDGMIIGTDGIASPSMFAIAGINASMDGVIGTAPTFVSSQSFKDAYKAEFSVDPTIFVAETYDAAMLIGEAIIEAESTDGKDVRDALSVVGNDYAGVTGTITFDENGDLIGGSYDIWQVHTTDPDASLDTVGSWDPATNVLTLVLNDLDTARFPVAPTVAVWTGPDFYAEEGAIPINLWFSIFGIISIAAIIRKRKK